MLDIKAVIMAGGKGTRIASINKNLPKPMIPIMGKPVLEYQIEALREQGCREIIIVIGHIGEKIKGYFGDGSAFGVSVSYIEEVNPLGTAGALYYLKGNIVTDFVLLNGDIIFDCDIERFMLFHKAHKALATIFVHPNNHPYDSGLIEVGNDGCVLQWIHKEDKRDWHHNLVNAGLHIISPRLLDDLDTPEKRDLDRDILKPLIKNGSLFAYKSPEYVKDMGIPERLKEVSKEIQSGFVKNRNLKRIQKAVFLDRDGTINKYVGFLTKEEEFELLDGVGVAIGRLNRSGYLVIVATNQPVIARGDITENGLDIIHRKMETLLGHEGSYLDDIFYCPHHPDRGFEGERAEYKISCDCRKPKPGMLLQAAKRYNISLKDSWMVGDSYNDVMAGKNADCHTAFIGQWRCNKNNPDIEGRSLLDCVEKILQFES